MQIARLAAVLAPLVTATVARADERTQSFDSSEMSTVSSTVAALDHKMPMVTPANRNIAKLAVFAFLVALIMGGANDKKPSFHASKTSTITSTVMAVDQRTRMATLANEDGELTFKVDNRIKNLEEVKPGDVVTATVTESISGRVLKQRESIPIASRCSTARSPTGAKTAGHTAKEVCMVATIAAIDRDSSVIMLRDPRGNTYPIQASDKQTVEKLAVDENVEIHATEAVAVEVTLPR